MSTSLPSISVQPPTPTQLTSTIPSTAPTPRVMAQSTSTTPSAGLSTPVTSEDFVQRGRQLVQDLRHRSVNSHVSLNQDDIFLVEHFVDSLRLDLRQHRLEMRLKDNKVECLTRQLKREQDRNHELRQTQSTKHEKAAAGERAWRKWAGEMKAKERAWQNWANAMKDTVLVHEEEAKALGKMVKSLTSRVVAAEIERDQISVILDFTRRELESKKAVTTTAKSAETQEASLESVKAAIDTANSSEPQETSLESEKADIDTASNSAPQETPEGGKAAIDAAKSPERPEASVSHKHECSICLDAEVDALFLRGHVACCMSCAEKLPAAKEGDELEAHCPLCDELGPFRRIYFA